MKLSVAIAPQYWSAAITAGFQQAITGYASVLLLDGGRVFQCWCFTMVAFWIGTVMIIYRRPLSPTRLDILFINAAFIPLFIFTCCVNFSIWHFGYEDVAW